LFPVPDALSSNTFDTFTTTETTPISKSHIDVLTDNRLLRLLLSYYFINASAPQNNDNVFNEFSKHNKNTVLACINKLELMGYISKEGPHSYKANTNYLFIPEKKDFKKLVLETIVDIVKTSDFNKKTNRYGNYKEGKYVYFRRTLTPDQLEYIMELFENSFFESKSLESKAGQEYNISYIIGALNEKKD